MSDLNHLGAMTPEQCVGSGYGYWDGIGYGIGWEEDA